MLAVVLFFVVFTSVMLALLCELSGKAMAVSMQKVIAAVILVSFTVLTIIIIPANNMDLSRYYRRIELFRTGGMVYFLQTLQEEAQWLFSMELLLISKTPYNFLAPMISCGITFAALYFICFDYIRKERLHNEKNRISMLMTLGLFFAWLPYFQIIDNLRSPISMAICAMSIYRQFFCRKSFLSQIGWYLAACLVHFQSVAILVFVAVYTFLPQIYRFRYLLVVIRSLFSVILWILQNIPILYVQMLARKVSRYMEASASDASLFNEFTISRIVLFLTMALLHEIILRRVKEKNERRYLELIQLIVFFSLGCAAIPEAIRRYSFVIAFFSPLELMMVKKYLSKAGCRLSEAVLWGEILAMQLWALLKLSRLTIEGVDLTPMFDFLSLFFDF